MHINRHMAGGEHGEVKRILRENMKANGNQNGFSVISDIPFPQLAFTWYVFDFQKYKAAVPFYRLFYSITRDSKRTHQASGVLPLRNLLWEM